MDTAEAVPRPRGRWTGLRQVLRYNWHLYLLAAAGEVAVVPALLALRLPGALRLLVAGAAVLGLAWSAGSLLVSHHVYDRSALYRLRWLEELAPPPAAWVNIHAGLDEASGALAGLYGAWYGRTLDVFDPRAMTEPSIARARRDGLGPPAERADFRRLPLAPGGSDVVLLLFSAHELRRREDRVQLLREAARALRPGGRVFLVEHLRDVWNFAAFGPGFLHFFSARSWRSVLADAGLEVRGERALTRFVRVFVGAAS